MCKLQTVFAFTALKSNIQTSFQSSVFPTLTVFKWITTFSEDFPTSINNSGYKMSEDELQFPTAKDNRFRCLLFLRLAVLGFFLLSGIFGVPPEELFSRAKGKLPEFTLAK